MIEGRTAYFAMSKKKKKVGAARNAQTSNKDPEARATVCLYKPTQATLAMPKKAVIFKERMKAYLYR